ncbi:MAG: 23S rRNA (guanosine(2251)-2'-O)-methyltransferase RlmB [Firmicutes bacterium]|nr:23S rRNA (guanosine(2251)-2'-O)-methyltransferase RlmB [Bacillota bacterium]
MELIGGKQTIIEALKSKYKIYNIYTENINNVDKEILELAKASHVEISEIPEDLRDAREISQGYLASVTDFNYRNLDEVKSKIKGDGLILVLDHLEDTHNLGAIIRTALCAGVNAIIIPDDRSVRVTSTVFKVSAGAIFYMPIIKVTNINKTIDTLKKDGYWVYGADMEGGTDVFKTKLDGNICLVVGNEGSGISQLVKKNCDAMVMIPQVGPLGSLNVSVATGIIIYEIFKQKVR